MGGARLRDNPVTLTCPACDQGWVSDAARLPKICPDCRADWRWCPKCDSAKAKSEFYASQKVGSPCRDCHARTPRDLVCALCTAEFTRTRRGGPAHTDARRKHLCDDCETTEKWCATCDQVKPREDFHKASDKRDGLVSRCIACQRVAWTQRTEADRRKRIARQYGITATEWDAMYLAQRGLCAICDQPPAPESRGLVVDHDHTSGEVRALLCGPCNIGLGHFADDESRLRSAADYLHNRASARGAR